METIKILILDDDSATYDGLLEAKVLYENYKFEMKYFNLLQPALDELKVNTGYDFAIVDLALSTPHGTEGNTFIDHLIKKFNIYPIVYSGQPGKATQSTTLISKLTRGEHSSEDIFNHIISIYSTGITSLLGENGNLQKHISNFYWEKLSRIYPTVDILINSEIDCEALTRLYLNYLSDELIANDQSEVKLHADELYIIPQVEEAPQNGSIIRYDKKLHLVVTPRCNIRGAKQIQMLKIGSLDPVIEELKKCGSDKKRSDVHQKIANGKYEKTHYLPPSTNFEGGVIEFLDIQTIHFDDFSNGDIIGKVSSEMMRNITSRYTSYYARQGQPEFYVNLEQLIDKAGQ